MKSDEKRTIRRDSYKTRLELSNDNLKVLTLKGVGEVEGAPYAIDGSDGSGSVCLVANDDCATCDDPENGGDEAEPPAQTT